MAAGSKRWALVSSFLLIGALMFFLVSCSASENTASSEEGQAGKPVLVLADAGWESIKFQNEVARFIIENGYGYKTEIIPGTTGVTMEGLKRGDIDIFMEIWTDNLDYYPAAVENGEILEVSVNYDDNRQGFYVPTYVIKGDPERGIKPMAPDLKAIEDLPKYWEIFRDPEDSSKGRIYGAIPDWVVDEIITKKVENYGLGETYNVFRPGSSTALITSLVDAMKAGEPWVGYFWEPEWVMGKYDLTYLEEPPYDPEEWESGGYRCAFPVVPVTVCVSTAMPQKAPEVVEFLKNYKTGTDIINRALAYMQDNNVEHAEAAVWFLKEYEDLWTTWVPEDVAKAVKEALTRK